MCRLTDVRESQGKQVHHTDRTRKGRATGVTDAEVDMMKKCGATGVQGRLGNRIFRLWSVAVVLVFAVAGGCGRSGNGVDDANKAATREVREIAAVTAKLLDVYLDARVTELLLCSTAHGKLEEALTTPDARHSANGTLSEWLKITRGFKAVLLVDRSGVCVASAPESLVDQDFSSESAFTGAMKGKLTVSEVHKSDVLIALDPKSRGWTLAIAVPIGTGNHSEGVVMCYLNWSQLNGLTDSVQVGMTGYVYVLNRRNQVILHPFKPFYGIGLRDRPINMPVLDNAITKRLAHKRYKFKNVRTHRLDTKVCGFAYPKKYGNFPGLGWTVVAVANESELVAEQVFWRKLFR